MDETKSPPNPADIDGLDEWYPSGDDESELIEFYLDGNCWHLALALHRETGWPICVMGPHAHRTAGSADLSFEHAACLHPSGLIVDVTGPNDTQTMRSRWGSDPLVLDEAEFVPACDIEFTPLAMANATDVAMRHVLSRHPDLTSSAIAPPRLP